MQRSGARAPIQGMVWYIHGSDPRCNFTNKGSRRYHLEYLEWVTRLAQYIVQSFKLVIIVNTLLGFQGNICFKFHRIISFLLRIICKGGRGGAGECDVSEQLFEALKMNYASDSFIHLWKHFYRIILRKERGRFVVILIFQRERTLFWLINVFEFHRCSARLSGLENLSREETLKVGLVMVGLPTQKSSSPIWCSAAHCRRHESCWCEGPAHSRWKLKCNNTCVPV